MPIITILKIIQIPYQNSNKLILVQNLKYKLNLNYNPVINCNSLKYKKYTIYINLTSIPQINMISNIKYMHYNFKN